LARGRGAHPCHGCWAAQLRATSSMTPTSPPASGEGSVAVTHTMPPAWRAVEVAPRRCAPISAGSPRASERAAVDAASCSLSCRVATWMPLRHTASSSTTAGTTSANSAVTEPRSAGEGERTLDEVGEHRAHLVAAHDDDEQPCEADGGHGRDDVLGRRCALIAAPAPKETEHENLHLI